MAEAISEAVFRAVLIGVKAGIFFLFLVYTYMTDISSERNPLKWFYLTALSLAALAAVELFHVLATIDPAMAFIPGIQDFALVRTVSVLAYVTAGLGAGLYLRAFRREL